VLGSLVFLRVPVQLVASGMRELLSMAPSPDVVDELRAVVGEVADRAGFEDAVLRAARVGSRMDIEIDFLLGASARSLTVTDCDAVRQEVHERLAALGLERSVVVTFTGERRWTE
jgi:predicted Co/Zn/Cd cation transporter (cation efflux family)